MQFKRILLILQTWYHHGGNTGIIIFNTQSKIYRVYFDNYNMNIIVCTREEYEGVSSINTDNPTFLDDNHIIMNKPYLP